MKYFRFSVLLWCALGLVTQVSAHNIQFDKIILSSIRISGQASPTEVSKYIILNNDRSMLITTEKMRHHECYSTEYNHNLSIGDVRTMAQGIANKTLFEQIMQAAHGIQVSKLTPIGSPISPIPTDMSIWQSDVTFVKNGIVQQNININSTYKYHEAIIKLIRLMEKLPENMHITQAPPKMSIAGIEYGFQSFGYFTAQKNNTDELYGLQFCTQNAEHYLLWNYLRKAKVMNAIADTTALPWKFRYPVRYVCENDTIVSGNLKINGRWENVASGETDGRYFRFIASSGVSIVLDIGHNFFTHTMQKYYNQRISKVKRE